MPSLGGDPDKVISSPWLTVLSIFLILLVVVVLMIMVIVAMRELLKSKKHKLPKFCVKYLHLVRLRSRDATLLPR